MLFCLDFDCYGIVKRIKITKLIVKCYTNMNVKILSE